MMLREMMMVSIAVLFALTAFVWMCKRKRLFAPLTFLVILGAGAGFFFCFRTELAATEYVIELGDPVSADPASYLTGMEFAVSRSEVDLGGVDARSAGCYEVNILHGWQYYTVRIMIRDTTPPELVLRDDEIFLERNKMYAADEFVLSAYDVSGEVELSVGREGAKEQGASVLCGECGSYTLFVRARDASGNVSGGELTVLVDAPPEFGAMPDYYVATGSSVDYLEFVSAWDETDGDVSKNITVDTSQLETAMTGNYILTYSVADSYGFVSTAENVIHVCEPMELQTLINEHQINRHDQKIVGALNLYDGGVYDGKDISSVLERVGPALVRLRVDMFGGGYSWGSGFIIQITDEDVIICSNAHVVKGFQSMDIYFHDGTKLTAEIMGVAGKSTTQDDVGFARVPIKDIPQKLFDTLQTIHINEQYWCGLDNECGIDIGLRCVQEDGSVWKEREGVLLRKEGHYDGYESYGVLTELSFELVNGMSGSAIVDNCGNLVAMATSSSNEGSSYRYWGVNLEHILSACEKILGYKPNYQ